jgi:F-type H+-transporting ATPase subunit delta
MKINKEARKASKAFLLGSFTNGRLDEAKIRTVVTQLAERKPRNYLEILQDYQRSIRLELEKHQALVESAVELDPAAREKLQQTLKRKYGDDLKIDFKVTPGLIGGLRIKIGSDVWDSSIQARLHALQTELVHA